MNTAIQKRKEPKKQVERQCLCKGCIYIRDEGKHTFKKVFLTSIYYIEAGRPYCCIVTTGSKFFLRKSLAETVVLLSPSTFLQVNKKQAVNIHLIAEISLSESWILLENESRVLIGREFKKAIKERLQILV